MIGKIDKTHISELMAELTSKQPRSADKTDKNSLDASVQIDYASLIKKATEIPESNIDKIETARQLINSGLLESAENYKQAANNMLVFGI
ncbi:MAG: hypothetical protein WCZ89_06395 [Phycisphaerae bacterium]